VTVWRVGMEAVCVNKRGWVAVDGSPFAGPDVGDVLTVRGVKCEPIRTRWFWQRWFGKKHVWLIFAAYPKSLLVATSFRPAQRTNSEIIARIKACRPARKPVEA
jgi:hypothetical protein